jgi:hypothetical protein
MQPTTTIDRLAVPPSARSTPLADARRRIAWACTRADAVGHPYRYRRRAGARASCGPGGLWRPLVPSRPGAKRARGPASESLHPVEGRGGPWSASGIPQLGGRCGVLNSRADYRPSSGMPPLPSRQHPGLSATRTIAAVTQVEVGRLGPAESRPGCHRSGPHGLCRARQARTAKAQGQRARARVHRGMANFISELRAALETLNAEQGQGPASQYAPRSSSSDGRAP